MGVPLEQLGSFQEIREFLGTIGIGWEKYGSFGKTMNGLGIIRIPEDNCDHLGIIGISLGRDWDIVGK